ncbi:MAG: phosphohistidine phosphatase SixA [Betaproteobacteria bacterium]|jgi:phosphohistidine phosphatase|nr:phosphohistidine phosphatase SixA [Betaproteobacteria bacterium]
MELLLWRHADAEDGLPDLERALTHKGHKQAGKVATWLDRHLPGNCRILVSPAQRAQQTAAALGRKFKTVPALAPDTAPSELLQLAGWPDGRESVLVVGHQPTLGQVAALLLGGLPQAWAIKKGAVWWLSNREREGGGQVVLRAAITPDLL